LRAASRQREIVVRRGRTRLRRYTFLGTTPWSFARAIVRAIYMVDLVNVNVAARKRRCAQNV
jgi:hypothetical protein